MSVAQQKQAGGAIVVRVEEHHAEQLSEFFRNVWDPQSTAARVRAARRAAAASNPHGAGEDVPTFVFIDAGRIAGYVTTIPIDLWNSGSERKAHWLKGLMVLPEYRNGPVGYLVLKEAIASLDLALAAVVAPDARRLFTALRFADLGIVANRIRILRPGNVIRKIAASELSAGLPRVVRTGLSIGSRPGLNGLAAAGAAAVTAAWSGAAGSTLRRGRIISELPDHADLQQLWRAARGEIDTAPARNAEYLVHRYGHGSGYHLISTTDGKRLTGFAAVRPPRAQGDPRLNGVRIATLAELVVRPGDQASMLALIGAAEQAARGLEADALLCSASHPTLLGALKRRAYLPYPGNVHVLLRQQSDTKMNLPATLMQWWLTRGDSAADEVF